MEKYREESFSFESLPAEVVQEILVLEDNPGLIPVDTQDIGPAFSVRLEKMNQVFSCRADQTVLQAASSAGVRLPSSCSSGACGTCKTRRVSGSVEMKHAGGIRQREIDQGWFLPCCSKPSSDLVLER